VADDELSLEVLKEITKDVFLLTAKINVDSQNCAIIEVSCKKKEFKS
jgi:hypothetical protein